MKIALVTKRVSQNLGGAERVSVNLAEKLSEAGHDVHIFTGHIDAAIEGTKTHLIKTIGWLAPLRLLSFQRKVRTMLRKEKFDLVYSLCQVYPVDIYRVGDGIHRHWMKVQFPGFFPRWMKYLTSLVHLAMRFLEGRIFQDDKRRLFITNSQLVKNQIIQYFHIPAEMINVIYNGVDHNLFSEDVKAFRDKTRRDYRIDDKDLVVLFVSNNWERKGLATIIEAIAKTGNESIRLVVVGRGNMRHYSSLARTKRMNTSQIIFTGRTADVGKYYGMADIFILPSRYEPFANVCLEAMACGLPVVTTKTNGASELIENGENGFLLETWDDADALSAIINEFSRRRVREEVGQKAAETAMGYTWERHLAETEKIFELLHKSRSE
ncbi:MAG: glycosyltransferase family 4 protein [Nitrospirae bacterium]|nr:glycosyltransferase family 4 protein [Nitrospirota bacterium]